MKKDIDKKNEEYIKQLLAGIEVDEQISESVEPQILAQISQRKQFNDQIAAYKKKARMGLIISLILLPIIGTLATLQLSRNLDFAASNIDIHSGYLAAFSIAALSLLFMVLEVRRRLG